MTQAEPLYHPGLAGIIAGETAISAVEQDSLMYRGYAIDDLAGKACFEEVAYLLLYGELPTATQLDEFRAAIDRQRALPEPLLAAIKSIPRAASMMDVLRTGVSMAGHFAPVVGNAREELLAQAAHVLAVVPTIIGARQRLLNGDEPVTPKPGLSHAAQLLYLASGVKPSAGDERVLDFTLTLYAEHEFNASAFAARVCTSTMSDLYSAVVAGIGTLKGPLHGGANEEACKLITRFQDADEARAWTHEAIARKEKLMGFGHRVYKHGDHRARLLERYVYELAADRDQRWRADVYDAIRDTVFEEKKLYPNLDYPCALTYFFLGLPLDMYTPIFVASRVSGWCAHAIEQACNNRIIRPTSRYTGPARRAWVPLESR